MRSDELCWVELCVATWLVMVVTGGGGADQLQITNCELYGPLRSDAPVLVVHAGGGGARALHRLLASLARVRRVGDALLLVVHAAPADARSRELVRQVRYCRAAQLHCPHEEDAPKLRWWWAARWVFERAPWAGAHRGPVVFLDAGQLVAPDALHMLQYARRAAPHHVVALGGPGRSRRYDLLALDSWRPSFAAGLALDRDTWRRVAAHCHLYCSHDDKGWSHSLARVFAAWGPRGAHMVACAAPRVQRATAARRALLTGRRPLFPPRVFAVHVWGAEGRVSSAAPLGPSAGDWPPDALARTLCLNPFLINDTEEILDKT